MEAIQQQFGQLPEAILADSGYCSEGILEHPESREQPAGKIEAYIATGKQKHDERRRPCRRGPLRKAAKRVERMKRKLQTKAGKAIMQHGNVWWNRCSYTSCKRADFVNSRYAEKPK